MNIRNLKIVLVIIVGLQGLIYALQNLANLEAAYGAVAYILSRADHVVYPVSIVPAITSPVLVWLALTSIILGELMVGALSFKGAMDLWRARTADASAFNAAKTYAILGSGMALVVWFGLFLVLGGALFQMWQTQLGQSSLGDALKFIASSGLVLLFVNMADE